MPDMIGSRVKLVYLDGKVTKTCYGEITEQTDKLLTIKFNDGQWKSIGINFIISISPTTEEVSRNGQV